MRKLKNTNIAKRIFGLLHLPALSLPCLTRQSPARDYRVTPDNDRGMLRPIMTALLAALALLLASCSNGISGTDTSGSSADGKTYISISAKTASSRSIAPSTDDYSTEKLTNLEVTGHMTSVITVDEPVTEPEEISLAQAESLAELSGKSIPIEAGNWLLTLSASLNGVTFYGETRTEIEKGKVNPISFTLTPETSYGGMSITVEFTGEADKVSVSLKKAGLEELLAGGELIPVEENDGKKSVTFSRSATSEEEKLESGSYYLLFEFFGLEEIGRLNTVENIVRVKEGITTTAKLTLDLNEIYTITYETNGGEPDTVLTDRYSRKSEAITLPEMKKSGCIFKGWYENSDTDHANPLEYIDSSRASDLTLVAYFEKILSTLYVTARTLEDGEEDTGDGSEANPFANISSALAQINEYASDTTDYTIVLSGEFVAMQELSSSLDGKAKSITLTGKTGNTTDILNGDIEGNNYHTLRVATTVPVTISNLKITGGRCGLSLGYDEENNADVQVDVTLDDGALVTDNGNSSGINLSAGKLTLKGGSIMNNCCEYGGGVAVTGGEFVMESGTIGGTEEGEANTADYRGAGVYITGGTFTMKGGTICGNKSSSSASGAGVYVGYDEENGTVGTFIMQGGTISANEAVTAGGGVFVDGTSTDLTQDVTFTMTGGTITENKQTSTYDEEERGGGGVALYGEHALFTMEGGTISKNEAACYGGGVSVVGSAKFHMTDGTIGGTSSADGNKVTQTSYSTYGGGVYVADDATFTMDGGTISYNATSSTSTTTGGGAVNAFSGTFTMNGGTLSNNTSAGSGGAVYIGSSGTCNLAGGTISANTCGTSAYGSGVYVRSFNSNSGTLTMSGSAVVASGNDVYLASGTKVTIAGSLTGISPVATITPASYTEDTQILTIADGADPTLAAEYEKFVLSDSDVWSITEEGTLKKLFIGTKKPTEAKAVYDIVFSDGSATPYADGLTLSDDEKAAAIAVIFYKGTGLNSPDSEGNADTTTERTLGVGLAQTQALWCGDPNGSNPGNAWNVLVEPIECAPNEGIFDYETTAGNYTFPDTADKNGSDNLSQIAAYLPTQTNSSNNYYTDDTGTAARYPAFYFGINYKDQTESHVSGTDYEDNWYLPSIAELLQLGKVVTDVNSAIGLCGGTLVKTSSGDNYYDYFSSSQYENYSYCTEAYTMRFETPLCIGTDEKTSDSVYVLAIREF